MKPRGCTVDKYKIIKHNYFEVHEVPILPVRLYFDYCQAQQDVHV